ncbi:glycoside hydrolase family 3 protein [Flavobacterium sp. W21_SRS_FM6]|uniref:glycoside hydrolase family 3 protein n=1 Tax=Flavobacterium sp. W21_SRS_FM6 TaxID=3240268 RepID=UPI003F8F9993
MKFTPLHTALLLSLVAVGGCSQAPDNNTTVENKATTTKVPDFWPALDIQIKSDPTVEAQVADLLSSMTIEQKVAQTIQPEIRDITVADMRRYGFGSYLNGGGAFPNNDKHATPQDWIALAQKMYLASIDDSEDGSTIPTMWGTDAVHGHNNVIGATLFPHNIGLGAAHNPDLMKQVAKITAKEVMATGIDWIFAPTVATVQDDRWGRTYESYSEDPAIIREYSHAFVEGLQGDPRSGYFNDDNVISTVKHFVGDGGTVNGDDQGDNVSSEQHLFERHAQGYVGGLSAGAQSVMASFNSWHGEKVHGSRYLLTEVLKERMGFDGFVVGDWNGHGQVPGCSNESCPQAMNAGLDIYMVATPAWKPLYENTLEQVKTGVISMSRLDDAVSRILRVKVRAGLFTKPAPADRKFANLDNVIGNEAHRAVARQAVRESLVLLKNNKQLLPIRPQQSILIAGDGADNIGKQSGGWTITWQGTGNNNQDFPGGHSIYQGIKEKVDAAGGTIVLSETGEYTDKPDVAIVVFGEEPYAEGNGDIDNLEYQRGNKRDLALLKKYKAAGIPTVSIFLSGRPLWVNPELNASDAFVAAWLPGSQGEGVADVIMANEAGDASYDFTGRLPFSWPMTPSQSPLNFYDEDYQPLFKLGYGLSYTSPAELANDLNEVVAEEASGTQTRALFDRRAIAPWYVATLDDGNVMQMNSSTLSTASLAIRTQDRRVQEDSLQLTWLDNSQAKFLLMSNFPEDFRALSDSHSTIQFDIKLLSGLPESISLSIECGEQCKGETSFVDLIDADNDQWQTITIDLQCFTNKGVNFASVIAPFVLQASENTSIVISDIVLTPQTKDLALLKCEL